MEKKPNPTFLLQWHLTERCNLKCKHCYQNEIYLNQENSTERKKEIIKEFVRFCKKIERIPRIAFTGGEPFLIKKQLFRLLDYCQNNFPEIKKSILTNGTLIKKEDIQLLKSVNIDYIQVSLDGGLEETHNFIRGKDTFKQAISSIKLLKKNNIRTAVMFVFHKKNYKEVPKLINLCEELGVDNLGITEFVPEGRGKEIQEMILTSNETKSLFIQVAKRQIKLKESKNNLTIDTKRPLWVLIKKEFPNHEDLFGGGCAAGFSGLTLMPNENIMPCRRMDIVIGNLRESTFFDIWYSSDLLWKLRRRNELGECSICENNIMCGGCKAVSYAISGNFFKKDPMCWYSNE